MSFLGVVWELVCVCEFGRYVDNSSEQKREEEIKGIERIFIFILYPRSMAEAALKAPVR